MARSSVRSSLSNGLDGSRRVPSTSLQSGPLWGSRRQGVYWIGTIKHELFTPWLPPGIAWIRGQLELGTKNGDGERIGFLHWQVVVCLRRKQSLLWFGDAFGSDTHWELTRSKAANDYVWKEATRIEGTQFELGAIPFHRDSFTDWDAIWDYAVAGNLLAIPANIRVQSYRTLKLIAKDHLQPVAMERVVYVFWGVTGTGKSRRAWEEAGTLAYPKDPSTKFWCGYNGQDHVIIDEFRGQIGISHMLRWVDRYPCNVETKHGATSLRATKIWITSNLPPDRWYDDLDSGTVAALMRRLDITAFLE